MSHTQSLNDLDDAKNAQHALEQALRLTALHRDHGVIASVGELQIRIAAAEALLALAGHSQVTAAEARLAAAEAARRGAELHVELLGVAFVQERAVGEYEPLVQVRRRLGDHYLNGVALTPV